MRHLLFRFIAVKALLRGAVFTAYPVQRRAGAAGLVVGAMVAKALIETPVCTGEYRTPSPIHSFPGLVGKGGVPDRNYDPSGFALW